MRRLLFIFLVVLSFDLFPQPGATLNFDGIDDYIDLPNLNSPFDVSAAHIKTFQLWFRNTTTQGQHVRIFSTGTANWSTGIWFGYAAGSPFLRFELSDGVGVGVAITGTTSIRGDNQWHQATGVINGTIATLYLDAVVEGTVNISGEGAMNAAMPIHIGNSYDNEFASYFQGAVDELRAWNRALCRGEIMATINCELTGTEPGLVAYYKFNQGIASGSNTSVINLPDQTINANTGTLTNFSLTGNTSNWTAPGAVASGNTCAPFTGPILTVSSTSSVLCSGNTATLSISGANSYSWNTGPISNTIAVSPGLTTTYTVSGTDQNGCSTSTTITQNVADCTGIQQLSTNNRMVHSYPNPFTSSFIIEVNKMIYDNLKIYNVIGSLVYSSSIESDKISVDLSDKPSGVYFITVSGKLGKETRKLIKQ